MSYSRLDDESLKDYTDRIYEDVKNVDLTYAVDYFNSGDLQEFVSTTFARTNATYDKLVDYMKSLKIPDEYMEEIFVYDYSVDEYNKCKNSQLDAEIARWGGESKTFSASVTPGVRKAFSPRAGGRAWRSAASPAGKIRKA